MRQILDVDTTTPGRPAMPTAHDQRRSDQLGLRGRLLNGQWEQDARRALQAHVKDDRLPAWGPAERSRCPFRSLCQQIGGALYREAPDVRGPAGSEQLLVTVSEAGFWPLMQRLSTDLVGLREQPIRLDYSTRGGLLHRPMDPSDVVMKALADAPDVPVVVEERQPRFNPETKKIEWVWEVLDTTDIDRPVHAILNGDRKKDLTGLYLPGLKEHPGGYAYRDSSGLPYIPVALYHAERTGRLWDSWYGVETVLGSLTVGVILTFFVHCIKDASFSTVLLINGTTGSPDVKDPGRSDRRKEMSTEPGSIIEVAPIDETAGQTTAIQLQPGADPVKIIEAIGLFEQGLAAYAGVSPSDITRQSADPRSGIALTVSNAGLRQAQSRFEPQLRRGDIDVIQKSAMLINRATGTKYPESGYSIAYPSIPLAPDEVEAQRKDLLEKMTAGLLSPVDAYMTLHPGLTSAEAIRDLDRIRRERAQFQLTTI